MAQANRLQPTARESPCERSKERSAPRLKRTVGRTIQMKRQRRMVYERNALAVLLIVLHALWAPSWAAAAGQISVESDAHLSERNEIG